MDPLVVDVWSDIACPWCFIGHRRLAMALAEEEPASVLVQRRAFEIDASLPAEGRGADAVAERFGGPDAMAEAHARLTELGRSAGIEFRFDRIERVPNTRLAHRVVKLADTAELGQMVLDGLYRAHFCDGVDLSDPDAVVEVASHCGLSARALSAALDEGAGELEVAEDERLAARLGISGVPFFLAAAQVGLSGAHEPEVLRQLIAAGRERASAV